jgi:hypothetical protein
LKEKKRKPEKKAKVPPKTTITPKQAVEPPRPKRELNTMIYRDLFKFLEGKVSTECFVNIHDQCYGNVDCECECHRG